MKPVDELNVVCCHTSNTVEMMKRGPSRCRSTGRGKVETSDGVGREMVDAGRLRESSMKEQNAKDR